MIVELNYLWDQTTPQYLNNFLGSNKIKLYSEIYV